MKRLHIAPEEKTAIEIPHQACEKRKEGDRIKAILLRSEAVDSFTNKPTITCISLDLI